MRFDSPRVRALMPLAVRPEGVSPREIGEPSTSEVTKTCKLLANHGFGSWRRLSPLESRFWATPEQYSAWLASKEPKPKPAKDPKRVASALKGLQPKKPTFTVAKPSGAQWDRSGPAFITSETKVTIWVPRTQAEWIADVVAA